MADGGASPRVRGVASRLGRRAARRSIPVVRQMEIADCGAACLAMLLGLHGRVVPLDEVRRRVGASGAGVSARDLVDAARTYGLAGRGVSLGLDELEHLPRGSILHWGFDHFVVLDAVTRGGVRIVDPARGRRTVPIEEAGRRFTGVALTFEPGAGFETGGRARRGFSRYVALLLDERGALARVLVASLLIQALALSLPLLIGLLVDRVVPRGDTGLLTVLAVGLSAVVGFQVASTALRSHLLAWLRAALDAKMSVAFVDRLARLPYAFFLARPAGDLLVRFESNRRIRETLTQASISTLLDGALAALYLLLIFAISPAMAGLVLALGALHLGVFVLTQRRHRELMAESLEMQGRSQSRLVDMLGAMEALKSMGAEGRAVEGWTHLLVDELNVELDRGRLTANVGAVTSGLALGSPLAILLLGAWLVLGGGLSLGAMLAVNALAAGFLAPLASLVVTALGLAELRSHVERIEDVMQHEPEQPASGRAAAPTLSGRVALESVSFRYAERGPWVLRDVSLDIAPGMKVAIVGRSGAGKSTLARLIVGLIVPEEGIVRLDGRDLGTLDLDSVRRQIGVVTQDAALFGGTVRDAIALADPNAAIDRVEEAARAAAIHDEIVAMPMGYDTPLADGGAGLSGGQRQRLALARALLAEPALLVLDEATSDLDAVTERGIVRALDARGVTRVIVAHRLSTVADADTILVLEAGRVVEQGDHASLVAANGAYARLVAAQTGLGGVPRRGPGGR